MSSPTNQTFVDTPLAQPCSWNVKGGYTPTLVNVTALIWFTIRFHVAKIPRSPVYVWVVTATYIVIGFPPSYTILIYIPYTLITVYNINITALHIDQDILYSYLL